MISPATVPPPPPLDLYPLVPPLAHLVPFVRLFSEGGPWEQPLQLVGIGRLFPSVSSLIEVPPRHSVQHQPCRAPGLIADDLRCGQVILYVLTHQQPAKQGQEELIREQVGLVKTH